MISYRISETDLLARIDKCKPNWRKRATDATDACRAAKKYASADVSGKKLEGLWSEIKEVFMELQHDKCCYCERKLASKTFGKVEHDVEHFRPKSRVKNWFTDAVKEEFPDWPAKLKRSGTQSTGYYLLPFDPRNYATACKECNSAIKSDYFPCGQKALLDAASPVDAMAEEPWLIFPLGDFDEPAENLIQFQGILAEPVFDVAADPRRHWRARVTIRFFHLNLPSPNGGPSEGRENLYRERAEAISELAECLDALETTKNAAMCKQREKKIARLISAESAHAGCRRSFLKLWIDPATRNLAAQIWAGVEKFLNGETD